jgi:hypothetical protein
VHTSPTQTVSESAHAFAKVAEIDRVRQNGGVGIFDLFNQQGEVIFDYTSALRPTNTPTIILTLSAPFNFHLR